MADCHDERSGNRFMKDLLERMPSRLLDVNLGTAR